MLPSIAPVLTSNQAMPFEPLRTDEPIEGPPAKTRDMDTQMLFGCTAFVIAALITYLLVLWPFFVFPESYLLSQLLLALGLGCVPATLFGIYACRRSGLPGGSGFVGGALTTSIFLYLRLDQMMLGLEVREAPKPEFPHSWTWIVPLVWLLIAVVATGLSLPKGLLPGEGEAHGPRP